MLKVHIVNQLIAVAVATTSRTKNDVDDRLWSSHIKSEGIYALTFSIGPPASTPSQCGLKEGKSALELEIG